MGKPVELVPLTCHVCSTPVPAEPDEVAWVCAQCGKGLLLDEKQGVVALDIFYSSAIPSNGRGKPFWVTEGRATLKRSSYSGSSDRDAAAFWSQSRRFFIPAYNCSLEDMLVIGVRLLAQQPVLENGPVCAFDPVTVNPGDVPSFAEFVVMAVEAGRKDKLKEVQIQLQLAPPSLWILT